jgi:rubrerythrin
MALALPLAAAAALSASLQPMTTREALARALDDERHAIAFYAAVIEKHGERRPFTNIIDAERRHAGSLLRQFERLGLEVPTNRWAEREFDVPDDFRQLCDEAVASEIRNVRLYDDLIAATDDPQVRRVFERLQAASRERHLPAFARHGSGWRPVDSADLSPEQREQRERAERAREALFGALMGELSQAMAEGGAAQAIEVCAERAPEIADEISRKRGVEIGRTSWKLRNPDNAPPAWAELVLGDRPERATFLVDRTGRLGALLPIRVMANCLACHGSREELAPGVAERVAELYPHDEATGFEAGDLRGWFWVETPPAGRGE